MCFHSKGLKQPRPHSWVLECTRSSFLKTQPFLSITVKASRWNIHFRGWLATWKSTVKSLPLSFWSVFNGGICGVSSFRFVPYNILYIPTESELKDTSSGLEITQQTVTQGHNIRWKENLASGTKYIKFRHHAASVRFFFLCSNT